MNEMNWHLLEDHTPIKSLNVEGGTVSAGSRVRLIPRENGDIFDLALAGQVAIVESLEQDYEGRCHVAVVLEDDPGRDLGMLRQPGHRFFFSPGEIELLGPQSAQESQT